MPRVTVLMPLYNGRTYIEECLQSVQEQTYTDWEFIIVNDIGSDDGCAEIVDRYAQEDPRIKLVQRMSGTRGIAESLNIGLDMAQGEYVARVDVDDPSEPDRLEKQVAFMDAHPEVSLCSCYCYSLTKNGMHLEVVPCEPEELKASLLFPNNIRHFGVMLRRRFFDEHSLRYKADCAVEDYELWTRALREGAIFANIPEVLVTHRWGFENISIKKGSLLEETAREISAEFLSQLGVETWKYYQELFSGWRAHQKQYAKNKEIFLQQGFDLLREIYECNATAHYCDQNALKKILLERWDWIRKSCGLQFTDEFWKLVQPADETPRINVVMPTFNSAEGISASIDSILNQTYTNWELLVINDFGSDDGTAEIVKAYAWADPRIRLIQTEERLGLAESLNLGMRESRGEYIARMDADDTSMPERFEKQIQYLDEHPNVGICGTWQHHYGNGKDWVHQAAPDPEVQKCRLLFWCDLCHSTLMLRRSAFLDNDLFYDPSAKAEDYELWTRAVEFMDIANIPEVLGEYNETSGITGGRVALLAEESGQISRRFLDRVLGVKLSRYDSFLLNGWKNPISKNEPDRSEQLDRLRLIFLEIYEKNKEVRFFDEHHLLEVLAAKWYWAKDDIDWKKTDYSDINKPEDIFTGISDELKEIADSHETTGTVPDSFLNHTDETGEKPSNSENSKPAGNFETLKENGAEPFHLQSETHISESEDRPHHQLKRFAARLFAPVLYPFRKVTKILMRDALRQIDRSIENWTWNRYQRTNQDIENWTWDRYQRTNQDIENWTWDRYQRTNQDVENWTWDRYQRTNQDIENWTWDRYQRTNKDIERWTWDRYQRTNKDIERWTWDRYQRTNHDIFSINQFKNNNANFVPLISGTKIRAVFLFQIPSFWPSLETLYLAMAHDGRFDIRLVCYDEAIDNTIKTDNAKEYLDKMNYNYVLWTDFDLNDFNPHIVFLQTQYDSNRREIFKRPSLMRNGYRPVVISYGIEIGYTFHARNDQFRKPVENSWMVYTLSDVMKREYLRYSKNPEKIKALGLPRFDGLYHKEWFPQHPEVTKAAKDRKVILWKVHFPKVITQVGQTILVTPAIQEYIRFAEQIDKYSDLFFVFMPHPRFKEFNDGEEIKRQTRGLLHILHNKPNVYIDDNDEYRPSLLNAEAVIIDRSAVMVEAGVVDVPVLFMTNADFYEPVTEAIRPLIDSYDQGTTCADMQKFLEKVRSGIDEHKEQRKAAFKQCIPYFDGKCGERIKEDIIKSLEEERDNALDKQLDRRTEQLEARISRLEQQLQDRAEALAASGKEDLNHGLEETKNSLIMQLDESDAKVDKSVERWTWERFQRIQKENEMLRRQIDYTYRDIMMVLEKQLEFVGKHDLELQTDFPVAADSLDTIVPHGTIRDNTRYPRFIKKCETIFGQDRGLSFLDLGCSGGGMVLDAVLRGHLGIGLEGSSASLDSQRAEWRLLRDNLFTCDISKPFSLNDKNTGKPFRFHVVTAWEVLEHITEEDLPQLFENIRNHLRPDGYFIASIANYDDIDPDSGVNWHVTVHSYDWWRQKFEAAGFTVCSELLEAEDLARGGYNPPNAYLPPSKEVDTERCFHIVVQK